MPQAVAYVVTTAATWISAAAANVTAYITGGNVIATKLVSTAVFYGAQLGVYYGLSVALTPNVPKAGPSTQTYRSSRPIRKRAYGRVRGSGPRVFFAAKADQSGDVVAIHDGRIQGFVDYWLNDDKVTLVGNVVQSGPDGRYWSPDQRVKIYSRTGVAGQTAIAEIGSVWPQWDANHRGEGVALIGVICRNGKLVHFPHDFPNGPPEYSVTYDAQWCYDPRDEGQDPADPDTWTWTRNTALQTLHFLAYERGRAWDWSETEVGTFNAANWARRFGATLAYWIDAADDCDEGVDLDGGGTEPRYESNFEFELTQDEATILNTLLNAMDGWLSQDGQGGYVLYAGKFRAPTVILTDTQIRSVRLQKGVQVESRVNEILVSITDPENKYAERELEPWTDSAAVALVGRTESEPLQLLQVQRNGQGRRLAKRRMLRHQALARGTIVMAWTPGAVGRRWLRVQLDTGPSVLADMIVERTSAMRIDLLRLEMSFDFISVDGEALEGWDPGTEEGTPPPVPEPPDLAELDPPTIDAAYVWWTAAPAPRASLHVTGPDSAALTWQLRKRKQGLTLWEPVESPDDGDVYPSPVLQSGDLVAGVVIEFQVRYLTGGAVPSEWSNTASVDTAFPDLPWTIDSDKVLADSAFFTADGGTL